MTADTVGGVWTYCLELTRALDKSGIEVGLATMGAPLSRQQAEEAFQISNLQLFESSFKLEWMNGPREDVRRSGEWLLGLEEDFHPEVVHLNGYAHGRLPRRSPVLIVGHSCVLSWWDSVKGECVPECREVYRREVSLGLKAADYVIAPTRAMLLCLERHYGRARRAKVRALSYTPERMAGGYVEVYRELLHGASKGK